MNFFLDSPSIFFSIISLFLEDVMVIHNVNLNCIVLLKMYTPIEDVKITCDSNLIMSSLFHDARHLEKLSGFSEIKSMDFKYS